MIRSRRQPRHHRLRFQSFKAVRVAAAKYKDVYPSNERYDNLERNLGICARNLHKPKQLKQALDNIDTIVGSLYSPAADDDLYEPLKATVQDLRQVVGCPDFSQDAQLPSGRSVETVEVSTSLL